MNRDFIKKMEKYETVSVVSLIIFCMIALIVLVIKQPLVFKDDNGKVCACMVDKSHPSLGQCDKVDFDKAYQVVSVSNCN